MGEKQGEAAPGLLQAAIKVAVLLAVPAAITWCVGQPFIFPSLGPSAFSLTVNRQSSSREVLGGHLIGVIAGFATFHLVAQGLSVTSLPVAFSPGLLRLAASGVVSVVITSVAMLRLRAHHPPACATTMIVSLGLLPTLTDAFFIMIAISIMYTVSRLPTFRKKPVTNSS